MNAPTLFDVDTAGKVRANDAVTSVAAARKITGRTEAKILALMADGVPRTADEIAAELVDVFPPTTKSALSRVANHRLIVPSGETRPSTRGCAQIVWKLAPSS